MGSVVSSPVDEFERWMLIVVRRKLVSSEFKKTSGPGREWAESFEVVIVRKPKRETTLRQIEQWKKQVVLGN